MGIGASTGQVADTDFKDLDYQQMETVDEIQTSLGDVSREDRQDYCHLCVNEGCEEYGHMNPSVCQGAKKRGHTCS